jgi:ABC-2 type transport system ATP-binding protein
VHDPTLPARWSVADYLQRSAELFGQPRDEGRSRARRVLDEMRLSNLLGRRLATLVPAERRLLQIARALVTDPTALIVEAPLADLDAPAQAAVARALGEVARTRKLVVSVWAVPSAGPERNLIDGTAELLILDAATLVARGAPRDVLGAGTWYRVTVLQNGKPLGELLERQGFAVILDAGTRSRSAVSGSSRFIVRVPAGASADAIVAAAVEVEAPLVELVDRGFVRE